MNPTSDLKLCTACHLKLPATSEFFYWSKRDGCWYSHCKPCRNQRAKLNLPVKNPRRSVWDEVRNSGSRTCTICGYTKPLVEFSKARTCVMGISQRCRGCTLTRRKALLQTTIMDSWPQLLLSGLHSRIHNKKIPCNLTTQDIRELWDSQKGLCYWFGVPLVVTTEKKHGCKPSLDRLVPSLGYTKGNVVLTCLVANLGRNSIPASDFSSFIMVLKKSISDAPFSDCLRNSSQGVINDTNQIRNSQIQR